MKHGLGLHQVLVFGRLGLGAAKVISHRAGNIPHLCQHAELPVGNIIQKHPGRENIVGHVTASLIQQHVHCLNQSRRCGVAGYNLVAVILGMYGRTLYGVEMGWFMIQPEHHHGANQQQCG